MFWKRRKNILIIRQDRIGDVVLSTALPREIKRHWPDARVSVMVRGFTRDLFLENPHVDEILTDDFTDATRKATFRRQVGELRRRRFTHALMLLPRARYNYMTFLAGIPVRVGVGMILYHVLTGVRCAMRHGYRDRRHEADYCLDQVRRIGVPATDMRPEIHLSDDERAAAAALRAEWTAGGRRAVGVHVTSGGSAPNWPPVVWAELVDRLRERPDTRVVITDRDVPAAAAGLEGVIYGGAGNPLRTTLVNLAALDVLVSASTGPMHMAAAVGTPTISLFCPDPSCHPERWGPLGNRAELVLPADAAYCQERCPGDTHACTFLGDGGIDVATVLDRIDALPGRAAADGRPGPRRPGSGER